ncbi:nucleotide exchange factor GrpE [Streptomyces sp. NPDC059176]|uniref:nucleotide exchange factor GrpE n=1 Tax=unclassified Streptomyces TaxID=2593676 RepID=UPI0036A377AB
MNRPTGAHGCGQPFLTLVPDRPGERRPDPGAERAHGGRGRGDPPDDAPSGRARGPVRIRGAAPQEELHEHERERTAELTADLQRLKAEYDNDRKRVRRDRQAVREIAVANVLRRFLPVLDALAGADEQGEVTGGFGHVARLLDAELASLGPEAVSGLGECFDPVVHEADSYRESDRVERSPACCPPRPAVLRLGYRGGDHLLRPARVEVTAPTAGP